METDNKVIAKWTELKAVIDGLEYDIAKNARGVAAAGVRSRKGLRTLKLKAAELVKLTVVLDKDKRASRPPRDKKAKTPGEAAVASSDDDE